MTPNTKGRRKRRHSRLPVGVGSLAEVLDGPDNREQNSAAADDIQKVEDIAPREPPLHSTGGQSAPRRCCGRAQSCPSFRPFSLFLGATAVRTLTAGPFSRRMISALFARTWSGTTIMMTCGDKKVLFRKEGGGKKRMGPSGKADGSISGRIADAPSSPCQRGTASGTTSPCR